jgi:phospholipid-transporting ATPase
MEANLKI